MVQQWNEQLAHISESLPHFAPELILSGSLLVVLLLQLFKTRYEILLAFTVLTFFSTFVMAGSAGLSIQQTLFNNIIKLDGFAVYLKLLMDLSGILCCLMSFRKPKHHSAEYLILIIAVVLGGHLLVMSTHFLMVFLSLELVSIGSYILAGYSFTRQGSEGSLKYFLFGSVASAIMLYGFSFLYGITGSIDFSSAVFIEQLIEKDQEMALFAAIMVLAGFLYKISATPMHLWAPDVYEAAPIPVLAFLSVAPKLAGLGVLFKFALAMNLFGNSPYDWQVILGVVSMLTITVGNFSALRQQNPKRLMAYSSIAHSGFLMIGIVSFLPQGIHFMLFYATIYMLMNFSVFLFLDLFEKHGIHTIADYSGKGKSFIWPSVLLLIGLVALTGLPPTSGFTAKLFIFTGLWQAYELSGKDFLLWLLLFGLLNTVIALFYYMRIPYLAFLKSSAPAQKPNFITFENFLGLLLIFAILLLFFMPGLLMGWINKINFVL